VEHSSEGNWAHEVFARAQLGDPRRTKRLVAIASAAAQHPAGTVTGTKQTPAGTEATFRFLESAHIATAGVADALFESTAIAAGREQHVIIPVDQSDLTFVDRRCARGLGPNANRLAGTLRSVQVMNALALDPDGVPIGLLDQQWWNRPEAKAPRGKDDPRESEERESWQWVRCLEASLERLGRLAPNTKAWFVLDRAADFWGVLQFGNREDVDLTVRAVHPRVIEKNGHKQGLWTTIAKSKVLGYYKVSIPAARGRVARVACLEIRAGSYRVRLRDNPKPQIWTTLGCVRVREVGPMPCGEEPIEWKLLTTFTIEDVDDARLVVQGYALRWRIEEFHKTWKSGCCDLENSQLRSLDALKRWGTILAAVATRIERLKLLSRTQPDLDARTEFTQDEIDAAIILTATKKHSIGGSMTLKEAVRLVAMAGGFMGRKGDGNPGSITIKRGLDSVVPAARALAVTRSCG
jgi:hypothetical protein